MEAAAVKALFAASPMRGGNEHRVAFLPDEERVIKDADVHALATESLYDYLTDLLLSNHYFDDRAARLAALEKLGLDRVTGPTALAASGLPRSKG
jgi:hypothetical protein